MNYVVIIGTSRSGHNWTSWMFRSWMGNNGIPFYQFENLRPDEFDKTKQNRLLSAGQEDDGMVFIQIRDYLNWTASWFKYLINRNQAYREAKAHSILYVWEALLKEAVGITSHINSKHTLLYDRFVLDENYRRSICDLLGARYNENTINKVPHNGNFSSFDGNRFDGLGAKMHVTSRWEWYLTEEGAPFLKYLHAKPEILDLYVEHMSVSDKQLELIQRVYAM